MTESKQPQKGRIFISYRRADSAGYAGRIYDRLVERFGEDAIFMDVDTIEGGVDFVKVLEDAVQSCDVLIALIGRQWLSIKDIYGKRRLDNPEDFVRIEVAAALKRNIRVIPVLVDGVEMPRSTELPDNLKALARRNALQVNHHSFNPDVNRLIEHSESALDEAEESKIMKAQALQVAREKATKEKIEREAVEKAAREKAEREVTEKLAKEKIAREKAEKEAAEKSQLEAEEQAEREKVDKLEKEKTKREPLRSPSSKIGRLIDTDENKLDELLQDATKETETQSSQRKPINQTAFWAIGFVVIFVIGMLVFNKLYEPQTPARTSSPSATATYTVSPSPPTKTPLPTFSLYLTQTPTALPVGDVCNNSIFLADVTVPDGTVMSPGIQFVKTWRIGNIGTCTWDDTYTLIYIAGSSPDLKPTNVSIGNVLSGNVVDISVALVAPSTAGQYEGHWRMRNNEGFYFGHIFSVYIEVKP